MHGGPDKPPNHSKPGDNGSCTIGALDDGSANILTPQLGSVKPVILKCSPGKIIWTKIQSLDINHLAVISIDETLKKILTDLRTDKGNCSKIYNKVSNIYRKQKIETSNIK